MKKFILLVLFTLTVSGKQFFAQNVNITLAGKLSYGGERLSNIWGWVDTADGKEYALVGAADGLSIVDVSVPSSPAEVIQIPVPPGSDSCIWREVKTWGNYAYVTTECGNMGLQIVELTNLPATNLATTTWSPALDSIDTLKTIHALHIDNGKLYLYGYGWQKGVLVADISTTPMNPVLLGRYDAGGYIHDGYVKNDTMYAAHIFGGNIEIVDLSNISAPVTLASFNTPNSFPHNTWLSSDGKTLFTTDEVAGSFLAAYNISNLGNIFETDRIQSNPGDSSIVHNTHIINKNGIDYAVTSWYKDGLTIVDVSNPSNLVQVGNYDTSPMSGPGYGGCWGVYPYLPSGIILASDIEEGLFVLNPTYVGVEENGMNKANVKVFPNPFSVAATLRVTNPGELQMESLGLKIFDIYGKEADPFVIRNSDGFVIRRAGIASGFYIYELIDQTEIIATGKLIVTE